jgi:hypothetical protein
VFVDTVRGSPNVIQSNNTNAQASWTNEFGSFLSTGFTVPYNTIYGETNFQTRTYASWTFREQPKFFDVVTFTSASSGNTTFNHNLGSTPGCVFIKNTQTSDPWIVYHTSVGNDAYLQLNSTAVQDSLTGAFSVSSTSVTISSSLMYTSQSYVAYVFAHNAGGFGLTGTDNVISCGSYTGNFTAGLEVNLGYEPQWVMIKRRSSVTGNWFLFDNMRGMPNGSADAYLYANTSDAEASFEYIAPTATGFKIDSTTGGLNASGGSYIYIAIRRGPMKVPTDATKVFGITTAAGTSPAYVSSFPVDVALRYQITGGDPTLQARLAGPKKNFTDYDFSESSDSNVTWDYQNGMFTTVGANSNQYGWLMRRAPSFMDVVCYTNPPSSPVDQTHAHNLGVVPTLVITKGRNQAGGWIVLLDSSILGSVKYMYLNTTAAAASGLTYSATTTQYTTSFIGNYNETQVAYLFATCPNVSKVGSYTGNGTTQTINCGFTGGARFVIIKRTDSTGDWYVYDTDRGMTVLTDPYFFLNDAAAQVATLGSVTTVSTGFALNSTILAAINISGGTYIFLAIA